MSSIKRIESGSEKLKELAPELFDMLVIVTDRLNDITDTEEYEVPQKVGDELQDIQNTIWELLNRDGNLNGVAEFN